MNTLTMKFGGTSVGSVEALAQATDIVLEQAEAWQRLVVVVSAMSGVTDSLLEGGRMAASGDNVRYQEILADLKVRHRSVIESMLSDRPERQQLLAAVDMLLEDYVINCRKLYDVGEVRPSLLDTIASLGERINARIFAALVQERGLTSRVVDATELIVTDETFQNAAPLMDASRLQISKTLIPLFEAGMIPVVTGFIGATEKGMTTTLGRGGSDYTAAIVGVCLEADEVWIWTDVDGVMTADPRIVPDSRAIGLLSYNEVSELAYFGAKVLHPKTIRPIIEGGIPLWVKNTFNPTFPGTRIVRDPERADGKVKAITAIQDLSMITVEGTGMLGVPGIAARTFSAVASQGASVLMISQASSEQSICFLIPTNKVPSVVRAIDDEMAHELARRDIDRVWALNNMVILTAVGAGLRSTPGISARIFGALGNANINVIAIAQGSSECSLSIVVNADDSIEAVRQIHREVILNG